MSHTGWVPDEEQSGWKPDAPAAGPKSTIGPPQPEATPPPVSGTWDTIKRYSGLEGASDAIGKAIHSTDPIENYTQEGRVEHPILSRVGDVTSGVKELMLGGQTAGKPMGTSSGVLNNPVTQSMAAAPDAAGAAAGTEDAISGMASRVPKPGTGLIRGIGHDLAKKYVGPRLADAILPEPAEALPGIPAGASRSDAAIGSPIAPPTGAGPTTTTGGPPIQMNVGKTISPPPEAAQGAGAGTGRRIIMPGERIDPTRVKVAGSAAQATEQDLRRLADNGDIAAREELVRRRLPLGPVDYSNVPLPH